MAWNGLSFTAAAELAGAARSGAAIGFQQSVLSGLGVLAPIVLRRHGVARVVGDRVRGRGAAARDRLARAAAAARLLGSAHARFRAARRAVRDRWRPRREPSPSLGGRGRGASPRGTLARGGWARGRGRPPRQPLRTCPAAGLWTRCQTRCQTPAGSARTSTRVPQGGRFDGALGVVAAIEAVERVGTGSVVVFRGEEVGCVGSRALVAAGGQLPRAFLELHVEQGPVLAERDVPVGVVTGIVGLCPRGARPRRTCGACRNDADGRP